MSNFSASRKQCIIFLLALNSGGELASFSKSISLSQHTQGLEGAILLFVAEAANKQTRRLPINKKHSLVSLEKTD